jgi:hypothetical protein
MRAAIAISALLISFFCASGTTLAQLGGLVPNRAPVNAVAGDGEYGGYHHSFGGYEPHPGYGRGGWGHGYGAHGGYGNGAGIGALYVLRYLPFSNPYASASTTGAAPAGFDYSHPIDTLSAAPEQSINAEGLARFVSARDWFRAGNAVVALEQAERAIELLPDDASLHEFRALCLFALGRFEEAATSLYAALSAGPGWDWPTLIRLYPNMNVYMNHLQALAAYTAANNQSAASRFVLAYHYLTQGHRDAALKRFKEVVALKPNDRLSAWFVGQLETGAESQPGAAITTAAEPAKPPQPTEPNATQPTNTTTSAGTPLPEGATISGTWTAHPTADTSVTLTIQEAGKFTWHVSAKGKDRDFTGAAGFGGGILTLIPDKLPPIVGWVSWTDAKHMTFRVIGAAPDSHGLAFSREL